MNGFMDLLGVRDVRAEDGTSVIHFTAGEQHLNPAGTIHGGVLASLVDTAMGYAAHDLGDEEEMLATSQLTTTYLNAGQPGEVLVRARVRKRGRHVLVCEAEIEQGDSALVHAVATFATVRD
jgi:uncharacterized protein (TIGR00369 family)